MRFNDEGGPAFRVVDDGYQLEKLVPPEKAAKCYDFGPAKDWLENQFKKQKDIFIQAGYNAEQIERFAQSYFNAMPSNTLGPVYGTYLLKKGFKNILGLVHIVLPNDSDKVNLNNGNQVSISSKHAILAVELLKDSDCPEHFETAIKLVFVAIRHFVRNDHVKGVDSILYIDRSVENSWADLGRQAILKRLEFYKRGSVVHSEILSETGSKVYQRDLYRGPYDFICLQ